jgi:hypothetical protein
MRAQVSIFIAIGLVVLIALGLILFLAADLDVETPEKDRIEYQTLAACLDQDLTYAVFLIGIYSGFLQPGEFLNLSYEVPGKEDIGESLKDYIKERSAACTGQEIGADIVLAAEAEATATMDVIRDSIAAKETVSASVQVNIPSMVEESREYDGWFSEGRYPAEVIQQGDSAIVILTDPDSLIFPATPYRFGFAVKGSR